MRDNEGQWDVAGPLKPRYSAWIVDEGVAYGCESQGPFCGFDPEGKQTWKEFFAEGSPKNIEMPGHVLAEIQAYARSRKLDGG